MGLFGTMLSAFAGNDRDEDSFSEYYEKDVCPRCGEEMLKRCSCDGWCCLSCGERMVTRMSMIENATVSTMQLISG